MATGKKNNKMILSASAFNSCMIEFTIPDFKEIIIKNIISLFLSFLNTERHEVVFHTQWFIGQYCSEREGRGYRCRCNSFPFYDGLLLLHATAPGKSRRFLISPNNQRRQSKVLFFYFYNTT